MRRKDFNFIPDRYLRKYFDHFLPTITSPPNSAKILTISYPHCVITAHRYNIKPTSALLFYFLYNPPPLGYHQQN